MRVRGSYNDDDHANDTNILSFPRLRTTRKELNEDYIHWVGHLVKRLRYLEAAIHAEAARTEQIAKITETIDK